MIIVQLLNYVINCMLSWMSRFYINLTFSTIHSKYLFTDPRMIPFYGGYISTNAHVNSLDYFGIQWFIQVTCSWQLIDYFQILQLFHIAISTKIDLLRNLVNSTALIIVLNLIPRDSCDSCVIPRFHTRFLKIHELIKVSNHVGSLSVCYSEIKHY